MTDSKKVDDVPLAAEIPNTSQNAVVKPPSATEHTYRGNEGFGEYTSNSDYIKGTPHFNDLTDFKTIKTLKTDNNADKQDNGYLINDDSDKNYPVINFTDNVVVTVPDLPPTPQGLILDSIDNMSVFLEGGDYNDTLLASTDDIWAGDCSPWNVEARQVINIDGKTQSHDVFSGGAGYDTIELSSGDDAFFLDNQCSPFYNDTVQARLFGIEEIRGNAGADVIDLTSNNYTVGNIVINGGAGDDYLLSNDGNDTLDGEAGADSLYGGDGDDRLIFDTIDISIDGGGDEDTLVFSDEAVDLTTLMTNIDNIEVFELNNTNLIVDKSSIDGASDIGNEITINGDVDSTVTLSGGWVVGASANGYTVYTYLDTTLNISDNITTSMLINDFL